MIETKPLMKERRAELLRADGAKVQYQELLDALAAEQYWREAVKNAQAIGSIGYENTLCAFCESDGHEADCAWILAQREV